MKDTFAELNPFDLRIDTFRAEGDTKAASGIRIIHLPTRIVVECQSGRSQHRNREEALRELRAKIQDRAREDA